MNYQYIVVYLILFLILFYNFTFRFSKNDLETAMKNLNNLRGFFAILIILGHFIQKLNPIPIFLAPIPKFSTICVSFYFFMSGYGLVYQFLNKKDYMKKFLLKKYLNIFIVLIGFLVLFYFFKIIGSILFNSTIDLVSINWYIIEISLLYFLFFIAYKIFPKSQNKRVIAISFMVFISVFIALLTRCPRAYYISELSFILGIIISEYSSKIKCIFSKRLINILFTLFVFIILGFSFSSFFVKEYSILDLVTHNLLCITSMIIFVEIFLFINFSNKLLIFLKKISFEMYLYQFPLLYFKNLLFDNNLIKYNVITMILFVIIVIILAFLGNILNQNIIKFVNKKMKLS